MGIKVQRWIIVAALLLTALQIVSLWSPPTFGPCLVSPQEHATSGKNDDQQTCPTLFQGSLILLGRVDHFLEQHDKSIIGLFTIVLAVSTIGLWLSTDKLWRAGKRQMKLIAANSTHQSKDMRASIAAARRAADAAMLSARASIGIELPLLRIEPGYAGFGVSRDIDGIDRPYSTEVEPRHFPLKLGVAGRSGMIFQKSLFIDGIPESTLMRSSIRNLQNRWKFISTNWKWTFPQTLTVN
jgi:hypothetical protein